MRLEITRAIAPWVMKVCVHLTYGDVWCDVVWRGLIWCMIKGRHAINGHEENLSFFQDDNVRAASITVRTSRASTAVCAWMNWLITAVNAGKDIMVPSVKTLLVRGSHVGITHRVFLTTTPFAVLNAIVLKLTLLTSVIITDMTESCVKMVRV